MLTKEIEAALNDQITMEAEASDAYLSMAAWCEDANLRGCAKFFYAQADEERVHMLKFFHYIANNDGKPKITSRSAPTSTFKDIVQVFTNSLKQEQGVTKSIHSLMDLSVKHKDYGTMQLLQWFVVEQQEEEQTFKELLDLTKLIGTESHGLFLLDKEVGERAGASADA